MVVADGKEYTSHKEYFESNSGIMFVNKKRNTKILLNAYSQPCVDCKLSWHPAAMTLDHVKRDGYKTSSGVRRYPSDMLEYPTELFAQELSKCEVVCGNCHKIREMRRDNIFTSKKWASYSKGNLLGALYADNSP